MTTNLILYHGVRDTPLTLYHGVRLVVKSRKEFTVIELHNNNNNGIQNFKRHFKRTSNIQTSSETICYDHSILET